MADAWVPGGGRAVKVAIGELGGASGASHAVFVLTSSLTEYIVKTTSAAARLGPYVPANEVICATFADILDLPVLPWDFIRMPGGEIGFGSLRMPSHQFAMMSPGIVADLENAELFGVIALFDLWLCNTDRHRGNLLARRARGGKYRLLLNDHSHALVHGRASPENLDEVFKNQVRPDRFFRCPELVSGAEANALMRQKLDVIEGLSLTTIEEVVSSLPDDWMTRQDQQRVASFIHRRSREVRSLMNGVTDLFPRMKGEVL